MYLGQSQLANSIWFKFGLINFEVIPTMKLIITYRPLSASLQTQAVQQFQHIF